MFQGISGFKISRDQLEVLGSVCCFLSADYIQSSDPYVLEKLKQCEDLSAQQISALESVLLGGNTSYGYKLTHTRIATLFSCPLYELRLTPDFPLRPSDSWNRTTLENLGLLPLYLTTNIWGIFSQVRPQGTAPATGARGCVCVCFSINSLSVCLCVRVCQTNKQRFLKTFIRDLRKNNKASEMKILNMMNEVNKISRVKIKRSAGENHCRNTAEPLLH